VVERAFAQGRRPDLDEHQTLHQLTMAKARRMMTSDQMKAFDVNLSPASERARYGDTPFGRGCLAALHLIEAGVRCVEVTLDGWDTHSNNRERQAGQVKILDPAFAALIRDLKQRGLLEHTVVICGGEFGRSPKVNPQAGRDHWPHGFSILMAGGGFAGGRVLGATDPNGASEMPDQPVAVEDLHASVQHLLGIDPSKVIMTPKGRPIALSQGRILRGIMA
jgi:uncharacterized protein (DUF1501 family)